MVMVLLNRIERKCCAVLVFVREFDRTQKRPTLQRSIGLAPTEVRFEDKFEEKEEGHGDFLSRGLSYHSNGRDAGGLDFWVRNGTR